MRRLKQQEESLVYVEIVRFLLAKGADPNLKGGQYRDALQAAVDGSAQGNTEDNNIDAVRLILDHDGDLQHRGGDYRSAMLAAVLTGNIVAAHLFIDLGVELEDEVFLEAIKSERASVVPRLFEKGVNVNAENKHGTALQFAIRNGDNSIIRQGNSISPPN